MQCMSTVAMVRRETGGWRVPILQFTFMGVLAGLAVAPFGREVREKEPPSGALAVIMNIIWIILPGLELAIFHLFMALILAITIIGLPLAAQHLKMTRLALIPFGFEVRDMY